MIAPASTTAWILPASGTLTTMTRPTTVDAWLLGGPVDGAFRSVECGLDGCPPELLMLCGGEVFVGSSDVPVPAPSAHAAYELEARSAEDKLWLYRYVGTLTP